MFSLNCFEPPQGVEPSGAVERLERLELSEIYRSNAERKACLILFRVSVEREPSFLWRRIAGIEPIP
jgi:hypothetical protein